MPFFRPVVALTLLALSSASLAQPAKGTALCPGRPALPALGADGRLMNHFSYADAAPADLAAVPAGFGSGNCQLVHREMSASLAALVAAARADTKVGNTIMGLSCHRTITRQRGLFCNPAKLKARGYAGQAKWIAPPGYSEHASGFAIDFAARNAPGCQASTCFAGTAVSRWLNANAKKYGFELSFPAGNKQGVSHEPWHWRWVGKPGDAAARADAVFKPARAAFPG
jgi:zinc D-Ala-D-Ala carboxypeptidase